MRSERWQGTTGPAPKILRRRNSGMARRSGERFADVSAEVFSPQRHGIEARVPLER
jgi:hypothetical protein